MAECMMKRRIAEFDESEVTATPGAVRNGKTFLGAGTDDQQAGMFLGKDDMMFHIDVGADHCDQVILQLFPLLDALLEHVDELCERCRQITK